MLKGCNGSILLKKSAMVSKAEKYASELEIFAWGRGFRVQISRRCAQKRHFQQSVHTQPGRTDFFNTIGRKLSVVESALRLFGNWWYKTEPMTTWIKAK
ncbi:hypothetical protein B7R56_13355 [Pseudomonas savastanoi pv. retacarpa]|uniref:Uncharacterized protein n=1 Tax=Pseudomonas savastanoi pv. savastanoi NCPPB 3335 TaxID=693985 RepID=A0ABC8BIT2_PSESS|nr:hypothetical protein PSA3335_26020 [Pseudomonas savastanoi pv. savastanoi NCPPB 3335]KTC55823.1 hypothetical protein AO258_20940 [Pseudomonas syringae ICMP 19498]OSR27917.1 hypothetical protein B7R56_13355 [Pseudomonas savastanoi pv. retacarpa]